MAREQLEILYTPPSESFWDVPGVSYRGETGTYRIFEQMTPSMNQDKLAEYSEKEKQKGNPHAIDSVLHFAIFSQAYALRSQNPETAESLRVFLQSGLREYINTLTRVVYNPEEETDQVIHNYKTPDSYTLEGKLVGPDGWIKDFPDKRVLEFLLKIQDAKQINNISRWINDTNTYLWRVNSKPIQQDERVVRFNANSDRLFLDCLRDTLARYPAFWVLRVE